MDNDGIWSEAIPSTLRNDQCERMKQIHRYGGKTPIRFVPAKQKSDEKEAATVAIKVSDCAKDYYRKFEGGSPEDAVRHYLRFLILAEKMGYEAKVKESKKEKKNQKSIVNSIPEDTIDADEETRRKEAEEYIVELDMLIEHNIDEYWNLWQRLMGTDLLEKWNSLAAKQCDAVGYIDRGGVRVDGKKRGRGFAGFNATIRAWFLIVMETNAAERHKLYIKTQVKMPYRGLLVSQFVERMKQLNDYTRYLPTQKDEEGAPDALPRGDVPLSDYELCDIILQALPTQYQTGYWARKKGKFFPCDVDEFLDDLKAIEPDCRQTMSLVEKIENGMNAPIPKKSTGGNGKDDQNKKRKVAFDSSAAEKKEKGSGSTKKGKVARFCKRCEKKSPKHKETHDTHHCRLWNEDLSPKSKRAFFLEAKTPASDNSATEMFAQIKLENKKLRKTVEKMAGKTKKPSKTKLRKLLAAMDDSSDSSDSDSE